MHSSWCNIMTLWRTHEYVIIIVVILWLNQSWFHVNFVYMHVPATHAQIIVLFLLHSTVYVYTVIWNVCLIVILIYIIIEKFRFIHMSQQESCKHQDNLKCQCPCWGVCQIHLGWIWHTPDKIQENTMEVIHHIDVKKLHTICWDQLISNNLLCLQNLKGHAIINI